MFPLGQQPTNSFAAIVRSPPKFVLGVVILFSIAIAATGVAGVRAAIISGHYADNWGRYSETSAPLWFWLSLGRPVSFALCGLAFFVWAMKALFRRRHDREWGLAGSGSVTNTIAEALKYPSNFLLSMAILISFALAAMGAAHLHGALVSGHDVNGWRVPYVQYSETTTPVLFWLLLGQPIVLAWCGFALFAWAIRASLRKRQIDGASAERP